MRPDRPLSRKIAVFMRSLQGSGGVERTMVNLSNSFAAHGHRVDLIMARRKGHFLGEIQPGVRVIDLQVKSARESLKTVPRLGRDAWYWTRMVMASKPHFVLGALPGLTDYLQRERPDAVISAMDYPNVVAIRAGELAGRPVPVIATVRNTLSVEVTHSGRRRIKAQTDVDRRFYPRADALVAVSRGVADDLARTLGNIPREKIRTIYNPVISPDHESRTAQPLSHPWFNGDGPPVVLAVGGLKPQKDFGTLFRAFARARKDRPLRLLVLGEGKLRGELTALAEDLGITADLQMPGFVENPFPYMARAAVFVLSSQWEGLPGVVIQALACGCPVVSTDCPSGPAEILENGRYGILVPVKNEQALAAAMLQTLKNPPAESRLTARGREFSVERATQQYLDLIEELSVRN
jgi:glycosyltransferase involved in cell wall biosynthesis